MADYIKKISLGLVFNFIDINIGSFDIVPDFIGYIFIIVGLNELYKETKVKDFFISMILNIILLINSIISIFINDTRIIESSTIIYMTIVSLITIMSIYYMYEGVITILDDDKFKNKVIDFQKKYVSISLFIAFILTFYVNLSYGFKSAITILSTVVGVIIWISLMVNLNSIINHLKNNESLVINEDI